MCWIVSKGGTPYKYYSYTSQKGPDYKGLTPVNKDKCGSYNGQKSYNCISNRYADSNRKIDYKDFNKGDVIDNDNINVFLNCLRNEISLRKSNGLYSNLNITNMEAVSKGTKVTTSQPNKMSELMIELNAFILKINDCKFKDTKYNSVEGHPITQGKLCQPIDLKTMVKAINGEYSDCICYADCTVYGYEWRCNCYGYCGCNYM